MIIDIVFAVLMIMAIIKGYSQGLIVAIFSLLAFIVGLAAALKLSVVVAGYLSNNLNVAGRWLPILSFVLVFIAVVLLVKWGAVLIKKTVSLALMGWLDKLLGIAVYVLLYLMIYSVMLFFATQAHLLSPQLQAESSTYSFTVPWGPKVIDGLGLLLPVFSNMFTGLKDFFGGLSQRIPPGS